VRSAIRPVFEAGQVLRGEEEIGVRAGLSSQEHRVESGKREILNYPGHSTASMMPARKLLDFALFAAYLGTRSRRPDRDNATITHPAILFREVDMLPRLALILMLVLGGCGGGTEDADELKAYVVKMQQFESSTKKIRDYITRLDDRGVQISVADLAAGRNLIDEYCAAVSAIEPPIYDDLRRAYNNYVAKIEQAKELAADSGRDLSRERGNVAIGLRHIEKMTIQHYGSAIDLLWLRQKLPDEMPLKWPE